jgi:hypothetical protein
MGAGIICELAWDVEDWTIVIDAQAGWAALLATSIFQSS